MTSGEFHSIELSQIVVVREERHRREIKPEKITELANSISRLGLIHPIVVTRGLVLVAGECRYTACKQLGWTHISAQYTDELPQEDLECIELEENVKRSDLSWTDHCKALLRLHSLRRSADPSWTEQNTADHIGYDRSTIAKYLKIARELEGGNERVAAAEKMSQAATIIRRDEDRKASAQFDLFNRSQADQTVESSARTPGVLTTDFRDFAPNYEGPRFNLLHCDFPYGINAQNFNQSSGPVHGDYDDRPETYWELLDTLAKNMDRICSESCHLVFWLSPRFLCETITWFGRHTNFEIDRYPLIWHKSDGSGIIPDPLRGPRRTYEMALFGSRGDRKIVRPVTNSYGAPIVRSDHMSVKPEPMLRHFFEMVVDETTIMLDPTCGSGSSLRAAEALGASHVLGLELNPEFAERALEALARARRLRAAS